ncbi:MAG: HU family DNA-binding protein [Eisenbergiella sp.]
MIKLDMIRCVTEKANVIYKANMEAAGKDPSKTFTHADVEAVLGAYAECILENYQDGKIPFPGVGNFDVKHVKERTGVVRFGDNAGDTWTKPAHDELQFKVSDKIYEE